VASFCAPILTAARNVGRQTVAFLTWLFSCLERSQTTQPDRSLMSWELLLVSLVTTIVLFYVPQRDWSNRRSKAVKALNSMILRTKLFIPYPCTARLNPEKRITIQKTVAPKKLISFARWACKKGPVCREAGRHRSFIVPNASNINRRPASTLLLAGAPFNHYVPVVRDSKATFRMPLLLLPKPHVKEKIQIIGLHFLL
jgi:hypothetical protein